MAIVFLLCSIGLGNIPKWPEPNPFSVSRHFGFESVNEATASEANGIIIVLSGPQYKTSMRLDGDTTNNGAGKHNGDSSLVGFVTGRHGPLNCDDTGSYTLPPDTTHYTCQRHRAYPVIRFRGTVLFDSSRYAGILMRSPFWTDFWWKYSNMVLDKDANGLRSWDSQATWCTDTTDNCFQPVTLVRDSLGYISFEHAPLFDSTSMIYQLSAANDTNQQHRPGPGKWHHVQVYMQNDSATGYAKVWVDGILNAYANIRGKNGVLAQFHAGVYCSPRVPSGSVWNDELFIVHVFDERMGILLYMAN